MLHFASIDAPALPVHDSFIMHHGYAAELEAHMREASHNRFRVEIRTPTLTVREVKVGSGEPADISTDAILAAPKGYAAYTTREQDRFANRGRRILRAS